MVIVGLPHKLFRIADEVANSPGARNLGKRNYERVFTTNVGSNLHRGVFPTFEDARSSAPPAKPIGYDNPESAEIYVERTDRILSSDYAAIFWLDRLFAHGATSVFDLGGNIGTSYYAFQRLMTYPSDLRWVIHDVPAVMARGREIASNRDTRGQLSFSETVESAGKADVLLAFGVLQFRDEPFVQMLSGLTALPRHLVINRLPLHPTDSYFTLQSIGTAFCPYRITAEATFLSSIGDLGYTLVDRWTTPENSCHIPFEKNHSLNGFHGFYLSLDPPGS